MLRLDRMRALVDVYPGVEREDEMVAAFDYCLHGKGGAAPSIDTAMHGLVDAAHVDHLHPDSGIAIATAADGEALTARSSATGWCGCRGAGPASSSASTSPRSRTRNPQAIGCILGGHGITAWGDTSARRPRPTRCGSSTPPSAYIAEHGKTEPFGAPLRRLRRAARTTERRAKAAALAPVDPRPRLHRQAAWSGTSPTTARVLDFLASSEHPRLAALGTSCPDHFLRTKVKPLVLDLPADASVEDAHRPADASCTSAYRDDYQAYYDRARDAGQSRRSAAPTR